MERLNRFARDVLIVIALVVVLDGCIQGLRDGWLTRYLDELRSVLTEPPHPAHR